MFVLMESNTRSFGEQLDLVYKYLNKQLADLHRIGVALYDETTDALKTFSYAGDMNSILSFYDYKLSNSHSLSRLKETLQPRVIQDLDLFKPNGREHAESVRKAGYKSSYIFPIYHSGTFLGMITFNSRQKNFFDEDTVADLKLAIAYITLMVVNLKNAQRTLEATIKTSLEITHEKDPETREHVGRVAHYARYIAQGVARQYQLTDEFAEYVFMFSPLHDIGKVSIPDDILRKPTSLTHEEFEVMKTHTTKGWELSQIILKNYGLDKIEQSEIINNIIRFHHEKLDGSGYPDGLKEHEIPTEAKIVAVADIFDALTTARPYKSPWTNEQAFEELLNMSNLGLLDRHCVQALIQSQDLVLEIQNLLADKQPA